MYDVWEEPVGSAQALITEYPPSLDLTNGSWRAVDDGADLLAGLGLVAAGAFDDRPFVLIDDDHLDYGIGKVDDGSIIQSTRIPETEDDITTVDDITVPGELRDRDSPTVGGGGGGGLVIGGDPTTGNDPQVPPPSSEPEIPEVRQSFLDALREFINQNRAREEVGDRNANSRFRRDPSNQTEIRVGSTTVYWDRSTQSFWFDSDGDGSTPETEFWVYRDGVWYDYNNNGDPGARVVTF